MQVSLQTFLEKMPFNLKALWYAPSGVGHRKMKNIWMRINGHEPQPGPYAGVKNWRRYHRRAKENVT